MHLSPRRKYIILGIIATLLVALLFLPQILSVALRGTAEQRLARLTGEPVKVTKLTIHLLPPSATFNSVAIGTPQETTGSRSLVTCESATMDVTYGTVFASDPHIKALAVNGLTVNPFVDAQGRSSFVTMINRIPPLRNELPVDKIELREVCIQTYLDAALKQHETETASRPGATHNIDAVPPHKDGEPDGSLSVASVSAQNLVLAPSGTTLGREIWIPTQLSGVLCTAPSLEQHDDPSRLPDGISIAQLKAEVAQSTSPGTPVRLRGVELENVQCASVFSAPGLKPADQRAIDAVRYAFGANEKDSNSPEKSNPAATREQSNPTEPDSTPLIDGVVVESLTVKHCTVETRGPDSLGRQAYWRLNNFDVHGTNLAYGSGKSLREPGMLELSANTGSDSGPGEVKLNIDHITGGFPRASFETHFSVHGLAAAAFNVMLQDRKGPGIQSGQADLAFDGGAHDGNLNVRGVVTLSKDFKAESAVMKIAKLTLGKPSEPLQIGGTLERPKVEMPDALGALVGLARVLPIK